MQQHTGQHVLSAAFEHVNGSRTESVHFGADLCTVDLSATLTSNAVRAAEDEANRAVWQNHPVHVRFVDETEAAHLPLRKPPARGGRLRLIEIEQVDLSACGGTHVARTGEVGLIGIVGFERYKGGTRIAFVCGERALGHYRVLRDRAAAVAGLLACAPADVASATERLQGEVKQQRQTFRVIQQRLIELEGERLRDSAISRNGLRIVARHLADWDIQGLKSLAAALASQPQYVAILLGGEPLTLVVARSREATVDAAAVIRAVTARFGGRGGGRPEVAQAGGLSGSAEEILAAAVERL